LPQVVSPDVRQAALDELRVKENVGTAV